MHSEGSHQHFGSSELNVSNLIEGPHLTKKKRVGPVPSPCFLPELLTQLLPFADAPVFSFRNDTFLSPADDMGAAGAKVVELEGGVSGSF